jgi:hypothetical protein
MNTTQIALAYHIYRTAYGTWLSGDSRGWFKKGHSGMKAPNWQLEDQSRERMAQDAVKLTPAQRTIVEETIEAHCRIRDWHLHAVNARTTHVHIVVTADRDADDVMEQFKAWCSRNLSDAARLEVPVAVKAGRRRWFTEGGGKEEIYDEEYLRNAIRYVLEGQ